MKISGLNCFMSRLLRIIFHTSIQYYLLTKRTVCFDVHFRQAVHFGRKKALTVSLLFLVLKNTTINYYLETVLKNHNQINCIISTKPKSPFLPPPP